ADLTRRPQTLGQQGFAIKGSHKTPPLVPGPAGARLSQRIGGLGALVGQAPQSEWPNYSRQMSRARRLRRHPRRTPKGAELSAQNCPGPRDFSRVLGTLGSVLGGPFGTGRDRSARRHELPEGPSDSGGSPMRTPFPPTCCKKQRDPHLRGGEGASRRGPPEVWIPRGNPRDRRQLAL